MKTFLFAAGASIPFFVNPSLSTDYLTKKVKEINEWRRIIEKYISETDPNIVIVPPETVVRVIENILKYIPNATFEQIAEVLDKISSYDMDPIPTNSMMNVVQCVLMDIMRCPNRQLGIGMQKVPFLFREIIVEAILELEKNHKSSNYKQLLEKQKEFISYAAKEEEASIISTNYDDCVPESLDGLGFETCFKKSNDRYLNQIDIKYFMNAPRVVYFPHGHLRFQYTDKENVIYWHDSECANNKRWNGLASLTLDSTLTVTSSGKYAYNFNTFITTGQTKDDSFNQMPYAIYYQRMACDIAKSDTIYIIGYSFGDDHFNRLMKSFLKIKDTNKVVIVDYYPDDISMVDEYRDQNNIITKICQVFGTEWSVICDSEQNLLPFDQSEVNKLNEDGFGKIFPNVYFYKKGYSDFLNEYTNVISQLL